MVPGRAASSATADPATRRRTGGGGPNGWPSSARERHLDELRRDDGQHGGHRGDRCEPRTGEDDAEGRGESGQEEDELESETAGCGDPGPAVLEEAPPEEDRHRAPRITDVEELRDGEGDEGDRSCFRRTGVSGERPAERAQGCGGERSGGALANRAGRGPSGSEAGRAARCRFLASRRDSRSRSRSWNGAGADDRFRFVPSVRRGVTCAGAAAPTAFTVPFDTTLR